jgi:hypothetical protein
MGAWGSLFSFTTICPEVVERPFDRLTVLSNVEGHQVYACFEAAPQNHITTATGILCAYLPVLWRACPPIVVRFGGGFGLGRRLGVKLKRDPHTPFKPAEGTLLFKLLLGQDTRVDSRKSLLNGI